VVLLLAVLLGGVAGMFSPRRPASDGRFARLGQRATRALCDANHGDGDAERR